MTKLPYIPLYVNDWSRDLEEHPLEIEGAWFRINCKLWWENAAGKSSKTIEQWGRILRTAEKKTTEILNYIQGNHIGDVRFYSNGDGTPMAEIICRRMQREWEIRQKKVEAGRKGADSRWGTDSKGDGIPHDTSLKYDNDNEIEDFSKLNNKTINLDTIITKWNTFAELNNLSKITEIEKGSERGSHLQNRMKKEGFNFDSLLEIIGKSPFLLGQTDPKPGSARFFATFDWIINKSNYQKIVEGNYLERTPVSGEDSFLKHMREKDERKNKENR